MITQEQKTTAARLSTRGFDAMPFFHGVRVALGRNTAMVYVTPTGYRGQVLMHTKQIHHFTGMSLPDLVKFLARW